MLWVQVNILVFFILFLVFLLGIIPSVLLREMFIQSESIYASVISIIINWTSMFIAIMTFIPLFVSPKIVFVYQYCFCYISKRILDALLFLIYGLITCLFFLFAFIFVPETQRKTPEYVQVLVANGYVYKEKNQH